MSTETEARQAYYSAGRIIGKYGHVFHTERNAIPDHEAELFIHRMGLLAQAKFSSPDDFASCRQAIAQSKEGLAVLEYFLDLWPLIKRAADWMIESGDFTEERFNNEFPDLINAVTAALCQVKVKADGGIAPPSGE